MATKKEMVAELVGLGANEDEIKELKNSELEAMLEKAKEASVPAEPTVEPTVEQGTPAEEPKADAPVEAPKADEPKADEPVAAADETEGEVLRETSQQLGIFRDYIYNVKHKGAVVVVENLGYGDAYVSEDGLAVVGKSKRLSFGESVKFEGVSKLYFASASQPVVQILEVK